jgi:DNA-binding PadR family transcriptional regulator
MAVYCISEVDISDNGIASSGITEGDSVGNGENIALTEAVFYILLSLFSPMHGYGIMQNVESISFGRVKLAAGTLYGAISAMLEKGWIRALPGEKDSRKKEYEITVSGKRVLDQEMLRQKELLENGNKIIGGNGQ